MATIEGAVNPLDAEEAALRTQWNALMAPYAKEYAPLLNGQAAAYGPDDETVAAEMFARFGDAPFYIALPAPKPPVASRPIKPERAISQ